VHLDTPKKERMEAGIYIQGGPQQTTITIEDTGLDTCVRASSLSFVMMFLPGFGTGFSVVLLRVVEMLFASVPPPGP